MKKPQKPFDTKIECTFAMRDRDGKRVCYFNIEKPSECRIGNDPDGIWVCPLPEAKK